MQTIKMDPPTWEYAMRIYLAVLENGTEEGKENARQELMRLAKLVDDMNAAKKEEQA